MALTLDPATEARIQQALATGPYSEPAELLNRALDSLEAEQVSLSTRRAEIIAELEESVAQARRGEGVTGEELRARYEIRKATLEKSQVVHT
jgi:Arc/MetJ-type ribon-helix-helix transcriptional regulator